MYNWKRFGLGQKRRVNCIESALVSSACDRDDFIDGENKGQKSTTRQTSVVLSLVLGSVQGASSSAPWGCADVNNAEP